MRVVLVYQGRYVVRQALELETLAAVVRSNGHEVFLVYDSNTFGVTDNVMQVPFLAGKLASCQKIAGRIISLTPDVIIFSVLPNTFEFCVQLAGLIKKNCAAPVVFTGLYPTLVPKQAMSEPVVDYVVEGETESAVPQLLFALISGQKKAMSRVDNLMFRSGKKIQKNSPGPLVDLDSLPLPDKDLFKPYENHLHSYAAMVSRGCPFSCSYCEETCLKKKYGPGFFRRKKVKSVMAELESARKKYRFSEVIFKDSYLSGNEKWLAELMRQYKDKINLPFKCFCTISGFTDKTARLLKDGGCYCIEFGLQTWNQDLRNKILNRNESNSDAKKAFQICARHKIYFDVDHMFNLPGESIADHEFGARQYIGLKYLNRIKVHYLVYLPTADIVEKGVQAGVLDKNMTQQIACGIASDFYDQTFADPANRSLAAGYAALYKILPLLPKTLINSLLKTSHIKALGKIPDTVIAALQTARALQTHDLRFAIYLRRYPAQILRASLQSLLGKSSLRG